MKTVELWFTSDYVNAFLEVARTKKMNYELVREMNKSSLYRVVYKEDWELVHLGMDIQLTLGQQWKKA